MKSLLLCVLVNVMFSAESLPMIQVHGSGSGLSVMTTMLERNVAGISGLYGLAMDVHPGQSYEISLISGMAHLIIVEGVDHELLSQHSVTRNGVMPVVIHLGKRVKPGGDIQEINVLYYKHLAGPAVLAVISALDSDDGRRVLREYGYK